LFAVPSLPFTVPYEADNLLSPVFLMRKLRCEEVSALAHETQYRRSKPDTSPRSLLRSSSTNPLVDPMTTTAHKTSTAPAFLSPKGEHRD
jgi:hypothetical protein